MSTLDKNQSRYYNKVKVMKDYTDVVPISVKISTAQKKKLDELALKLNRSQSELVREAIMALLGLYYSRKQEGKCLK